MGRWAGSGKTTCESCNSLSVNKIHSYGHLQPGRWWSWRWTRGDEPAGSITARAEQGALILSYRYRAYSDEWLPVEQRVPLTWTDCHFGGRRPWFICAVRANGRYCGRRVGKLYIAGKLWACRHCYKLAYASQQEAMRSRGLGMAQRLRMRLGGDPGLDGPLPEKPARMHWRTYNRIIDRISVAEERANAALAYWVLQLGGKL